MITKATKGKQREFIQRENIHKNRKNISLLYSKKGGKPILKVTTKLSINTNTLELSVPNPLLKRNLRHLNSSVLGFKPLLNKRWPQSILLSSLTATTTFLIWFQASTAGIFFIKTPAMNTSSTRIRLIILILCLVEMKRKKR